MGLKRLLRIILAGGLIMSAAGCSVSRYSPEATASAETTDTEAVTTAETTAATYFPLPAELPGVEILPDPLRENGVGIRSQDASLSPSEYIKGIFLPSGTPPSWDVAQWNSGPCLWDEGTVIDGRTLTDGVTKWVTFGEDGDMTLRINTLPYYNGSPVSLSDPWPHLLVESEDLLPTGVGVGRAQSITVSMDVRLTSSYLFPVDGDEVRAAQLLCYLYITDESGQDFVWFGLQLFDSRGSQPMLLHLDEGSGRMIYALSTSDSYSGGRHPTVYADQTVRYGEWCHIELDIMPHLESLVAAGVDSGFFTAISSVEDICISGTNIGWEIHGSYDITAEIANYSVKAVY